MDVRYIVLVFLYLVATVNCNVQEEETSSNAASEENATAVRVIQKRGSLLPTNPDGSVQENGVGLKSIFIQVLAGVFKGVLNAKGISSEQIDQAVNLFNPQKIYNDLQLLRRGLSLLLRLFSVLMKYLPSSSSVLNPFSNLGSKIAIYALQPNPENGQLVSFNQSRPIMIPMVPERIKNIIDFVSTIPAPAVSSSSTGGNSFTGSSGSANSATVGVEAGSDSSNEPSIATEAPQSETTVEVVSTTAPTPVPTGDRNGNGEEPVGEVVQVYGVPAPVDFRYSSDDKSTSVNVPLPTYGAPLNGRRNFTTDISKPQGAKTVPNEKYGLPPYSGRNSNKSGLPNQGENDAFAGLPNFERGARFLDNDLDLEQRHSTKKGDVNSIADLPLERDTDRTNDKLRDSFGKPVST